MVDLSRLYFECHVTLEPPQSGTKKKQLEFISNQHGFRVATFEMSQKGEEAKGFTSCRDQSYSRICIRAKIFCEELKKKNFTVIRVKVEDTLLDTKHEADIWKFLGDDSTEIPF